MKEFDLDKAIQGFPVITRKGHKITSFYYDKDAVDDRPITAFIEGFGLTRLTKDGKFNSYGKDSDFDLFMDFESKEAWVNLYTSEDGRMYVGGVIYNTAEEALEEGKSKIPYKTTAKITWSE